MALAVAVAEARGACHIPAGSESARPSAHMAAGVALPDGDRWVGTASDGELDPPPVRAGRRTQWLGAPDVPM